MQSCSWSTASAGTLTRAGSHAAPVLRLLCPAADDALWYLSDYYGTTEARYPFQGVQGPCRHKPANATVAPAWGDMKLMPTRGVAGIAADPASIMSAVATYGPVVHYFSVQDSFYGYSSGERRVRVPVWRRAGRMRVARVAVRGWRQVAHTPAGDDAPPPLPRPCAGIYQASECVPGWYNHAMVGLLGCLCLRMPPWNRAALP